ncbi:MAG TPA: DUF6184 family natural product biosynthesis lipoprotein [Polyangia bacterium]|jgi:hypothetical protein
MTKTGMTAIAVLSLVVSISGATSCGGVSGSDVVNARNQATTASCNYFMMCNEIGAGMSATGGYDTYQDCTTKVVSSWTSAWPTTTCQGHIDETALGKCIDAINSNGAGDCNGVAVLLTLTKCGSGTVCDANVTDAAAGN